MDTNKIMIIANTPSPFRSESNVYDVNGISPTLTARDHKGPVKVLIKNATKKGYLIAEDGDGIDTAYPESKTRRGRAQKNMAHTLTTDDSKGVVVGTSNTITTVQKDNYVGEPRAVKLQNSNMKGRRIKEQGEPMFTVTAHDRNAVTVGEETTSLRIRKLTPKECWRLMGCSDEDFHKAEQVNSNTQLYKQAGNAIVVNVLEAIFKQMFLKELEEENEQEGSD